MKYQFMQAHQQEFCERYKGVGSEWHLLNSYRSDVMYKQANSSDTVGASTPIDLSPEA